MRLCSLVTVSLYSTYSVLLFSLFCLCVFLSVFLFFSVFRGLAAWNKLGLIDWLIELTVLHFTRTLDLFIFVCICLYASNDILCQILPIRFTLLYKVPHFVTVGVVAYIQSTQTVTVHETEAVSTGTQRSCKYAGPHHGCIPISHLDGDLENDLLPYWKRSTIAVVCNADSTIHRLRSASLICGWHADYARQRLWTRTECGSTLYRFSSAAYLCYLISYWAYNYILDLQPQ